MKNIDELELYFFNPWDWQDAPTEISFKKPGECDHEWEKYVGLKEVYYHCKKCGKKDEKVYNK